MRSNPSPLAYHLITTAPALEDLITHLNLEKRFAVDLEADSLFHYQEKICLIQISTERATFIVDPLSLSHIGDFQAVMANDQIQKIFHSADNDLRSLYRDYGIVIHNLFDTQLACRFLGQRSTGLETVLKERFNVALNKKFQKKDWSQRPLSNDMLSYAAQDTCHLIQLADILTSELVEKGRLEWFEEECTLLTQVRPPEPLNQPLFYKFKGAHHLRPRQLAALENLLQVRDALAREKDRPLFKLISNEALLRIARLLPDSLQQLQHSGALSARQMNQYADLLMAALQNAMRQPESQLPSYPSGKAPKIAPDVAERIAALKQWRLNRSADLQLEPGLLCNNNLIQALATSFPQTLEGLASLPEIKRWQAHNFGREILDVLLKFEG